MRAVMQDEYGPADRLSIGEVQRPVPGPDEVLVRVVAAGVDPGVWHMMTGRPYLMRPFVGLRRPRARVRGRDLAGVVESVGAKVTRFQPGDKVYGAGEGTYAEYTRARESHLAAKPANLGFEQAAVVPVSGTTALQAVRDSAKVQPGQSVLVIGAAGGVGTYAVQLAHARGATVTGVCSTGKLDLVRSIGAAAVIDYTREDFADGRRRFDVIIDTAGNRSLSHLRRALAPRGTLVLIGGEGGSRMFGGLSRQLRAGLLSPFIGQKLVGQFTTGGWRDLEALTVLIEAGALTPVIERSYPLSGVPEAIRRIENGQARGKAVIVV